MLHEILASIAATSTIGIVAWFLNIHARLSAIESQIRTHSEQFSAMSQDVRDIRNFLMEHTKNESR